MKVRTDGHHEPAFSEIVEDLAHRVSRLGPDRRDPHRFHEEKSEIAHQLRELSRVLPWGGCTGNSHPGNSGGARTAKGLKS